MSAEGFEPEKYRDEYRERFLATVDQKLKGQQVTVQPPAPERQGKVVDIFAALKQSLDQAAPRGQRATKKVCRVTKTARKRPNA